MVRAMTPDIAAQLDAALAALKAGALDRAFSLAKTALKVAPDAEPAQTVAGLVFCELGLWQRAVDCLEKSLTQKPGAAKFSALGLAQFQLGRLKQAEAAYQAALQRRPDDLAGLIQLGKILTQRGKLEQAETINARALALAPQNAEVLSNLGYAGLAQLQPAVAADWFRQALAQQPDNIAAHDGLLMSLAYLDDTTLEDLRAAHLAYGAAMTQSPLSRRVDSGDPNRKLRIGFLSADLRRHSVAYFLLPVLQHLDRTAFEILLYADNRASDDYTAKFQALADHWRLVNGRKDAELHRMIAEDAVDILIELGGHTAGNRLGALAQKPAPVQITWLGYPGPSGLPAMDWRIVDAVAHPWPISPGPDRPLFLPGGYHCYQAPQEAPAVALRPNGADIVFGSFNNAIKIGPRCAALWSRVLQAVPQSRLLLKSVNMASAMQRERLLGLFAEPGRITLLDTAPDAAAHLAQYAQVDIALDTLPYNGTTTTCEALWMGVPVIGLRGAVPAARVGESLLLQAGLPELVAEDEAAFVAKAVDLAGDAGRRAALRQGLRGHMAASRLCDAARFAAAFGAALRQAWREYRSSQSPAG